MIRNPVYLINSFSASMLADLPSSVMFDEVTLEEARELMRAASSLSMRSAVGHADTAALFSSLLRVPVACERLDVKLRVGDCALLGQYFGPRLPEGTTTLPEGALIRWLAVVVDK